MKIIRYFMFLGVFLLPSLFIPSHPMALANQDSFSWELLQEDPFFVQESGSSKLNGNFYISFSVPEKHFLYRNKLNIYFAEDSGVQVVDIEYPDSIIKEDPYFGKKLDIYDDDFILLVTVSPKEPSYFNQKREITGILTYQGCNDKLCFPMQEVEILVHFQLKDRVSSTSSTTTIVSFSSTAGDNSVWFFLFSFLAGVFAVFTPCVLPLIPLTFVFIGIRKGHSIRKNFILSLFLVLGMATSFAVLGLIATLIGRSLGFVFQYSWISILFSIFFFLMALSMFGLFELKIPASLQKRVTKLGGKGKVGSFIAGTTLGFLAGPCLGPLLAGILLVVAQSDSSLYGISLLLFFGLGMGIPFLIMGTFFESFTRKVKNPMIGLVVKILLGLMLLMPSAYYGWVAWKQISPQINGWVVDEKGGWHSNLDIALEQSKLLNKPLMIKYGADWCIPCLALDRQLKEDKSLIAELEHFVLLAVDCTSNTETCVSSQKKYKVNGVPTVVFVSPDGKDINIIGGFTINKLLRDMKEFQEKINKNES